MADDRLHFLSIAELSRLIEGRQISQVELTRSMLDRIGSWDSRYQSYATVTTERATAAAASAEAPDVFWHLSGTPSWCARGGQGPLLCQGFTYHGRHAGPSRTRS